MSRGEELLAAFQAALPAGSPVPDLTLLAPALTTMLDAGRAAWPGLALEATDFAAFVAERCEGGALPPRAYAADLFLACACLHRVRGATELFCRAFAGDVERAIARVSSSAHVVEEVRQALHERLFVGPGGSAGKIAGYGGRAALATWVHVAAARLAINLEVKEKGAKRRESAEDARPVVDTELEYFKRRYASDFEAAVRAGVQRLPAEARAVLRGHLVEGLTVDGLAERLGVGRSTAGRRLAAARGELLRRTHEELRARLRLSASELESLAALVESRLHLSLAGLLRDAPVASRKGRRE
jgi:RNA polymerase sigma-70 factor (ECF subfamily)